MPTESLMFERLGIALVLGLLVGLQREHSAASLIGVRTFPLITVLGTVSAILGQSYGGWVVAAGLVGVAGLVAWSHLVRLRRHPPEVGLTTDMAALLMFGVGALLIVAPREVGIAVGAGVAVLLQFKPELHRVAQKLGDEDLKAIMQFVLITCIILPVLPNQTYGPLEVFNPFETWLLVVLIVGINLGGYIAYKFLGQSAGILLGGVLGGAISSTATTLSYARRARGQLSSAPAAAAVILIASGVVFVRIALLAAVGTEQFIQTSLPPFLILAALAIGPALAAWYCVRRQPSQPPEHENPSQLKSAIFFGAMYVLVLFALAGAKQFFGGFGNRAMYLVAGLSGLTDMDAITLSTARMSASDPQIAASGWRLIVVAAMANLAFKTALAGLLGGLRLAVRLLGLFSIPLAGGVLLLGLWGS